MIAGDPRVGQMCDSFRKRAELGFRPKTKRGYEIKFKVFMSVCVYLKIKEVDSVQAISAFLEYLIQRGVRSVTLQGYLSSIKYYFQLYGMRSGNVSHRIVTMGLRSVSHNAPLKGSAKLVISVCCKQQLHR